MNDREWEKFFEYLELIVTEEKAVMDKIAEVRRQAALNVCDEILEEFNAWNFGYDNAE